ncbi:MAG: complex I subunit 5 family protein [Thiohalospira sp.]
MSPVIGLSLLLVLLPLVGAVVATLLPARAGSIALASATAALVAVLALIQGLAASGPAAATLGGWPEMLGIGVAVDGTAALFLLATALVGLAATAHGLGYFPRRHPFWALWLLLQAALNAVFVTADAFNAYVALELAGLTAAVLVTLGGERDAVAAGLRYLLVSLAGATLYLGGVALAYAATGTLSLAVLAELPVPAAAAVLILAGLLLKAAVFPLHGWLPPAHARAPGPVSAILSALVVKAALYLVWRWLAIAPSAAEAVALLGVGAVIWGSLQALRVGRLKAIIAWSTVAQMGYLAVGVVLAVEGAPGAAMGVAWLALSHALAKGAAFLGAASVVRAAGHDRWPLAAAHLRGRPVLVLAFGLAAVSLAGLPPSGGFVAKWYLLQVGAEAGRWGLMALIAGGGLLSAAYLYRILHPGLDPRPGAEPERPTGGILEWSALGLALLVTALGLVVPWAHELVEGRP